MKKNKSRWYWIAKTFVSFFMLFSAYYLHVHAEAFKMLGFPDYLRKELVIAKVIGAIVLLFPFTPMRVKEWIYAGFIITMISALIAHICSHDMISKVIFVSVDTLIILTAIRYVSKTEYALAKQISSQN